MYTVYSLTGDGSVTFLNAYPNLHTFEHVKPLIIILNLFSNAFVSGDIKIFVIFSNCGEIIRYNTYKSYAWVYFIGDLRNFIH